MSFKRYDASNIRTNDNKLYKELLDARDIKKVKQYVSPRFSQLTVEKRASLDKVTHIWTHGDKLYKLAHKYYGDSTLWWVIAWYNQTPTESHINLGDQLQIPLPLERILSYYSSGTD